MYNQSSYDMPSAMITDDIAFIGNARVSIHCIVSDAGLILLDTGYPDMFDVIASNLKRIGHDIHNVKYIIHSHGHIDHYGCTADIVDLTGAKTLLGKEDVPIVSGQVNLSWADELLMDHPKSFYPDIMFSDGDVLNLNEHSIRFIHAPGHTAGTYALLIDTFVNGSPMVAAMHGGVGTNSMSREFLNAYNLPLSCREEFRDGLHRLAKEKVDIVLGNHPDQNNTAGKLLAISKAQNPFVDKGEWKRFLAECETRLDYMLNQEASNDVSL